MGLMVNDCKSMEMKEENSDKQNEEEIEDLEWSPDQEILLLYSLHGYKPVGPVKYFNMFVIQERLSSAMNKQISSKAIWKKLNNMYDLEALDEAEAELSALEKVDIDFSLPESEFGELINAKLAGKELTIKVENQDDDDQNDAEGNEVLYENKTDSENNEEDFKDSTDTPKGAGAERGFKKEIVKRGSKKKDASSMKENASLKKENVKEANKKETPSKKESTKELKKLGVKDDDKKEAGKKTIQDVKKDVGKEDKKEISTTKGNKRESLNKSSIEQLKKEVEIKRPDPKKTPNQRGGPIQPRSETPKQTTLENKRAEAKTLRSETPKLVRADATPKPQRTEAQKKDVNNDKKKDTLDKAERKSPEKTPESGRGSTLRIREKKASETETISNKRERSKDLISKGESAVEESPAKKAKIAITKTRPTRNSIEPQQKPASPSPPQKRRARP